MTGSTDFSLEITAKFERSLKLIATKDLKDKLKEYLKELTENPYHDKSRQEPQPGGYSIPVGWTFRKLVFKINKGASGQIRLMYLVNEEIKIIKLVWVYNHEQFRKRPPDKELVKLIKELMSG